MTSTISAEPFHLDGSSDTAVLMIHGFSGTPVTLRQWGEALHEQGWTVSAPLLPGHGTRWQDLNEVTWQDWYRTANHAFHKLTTNHKHVFVAGLSMGSVLSLRLAEEHDYRVAGIMIVNPAVLRPQKREVPVLLAADRIGLFNLLTRVVPSVPGLGQDIKKPGLDQRIAYDRISLNAVLQLIKLQDVVRADLAKVTQPLMVFSSAEDHVVEPINSEAVMEQVSSGDKIRVELPDSYHVATLDNDAETIINRSVDFVTSHR